MSIMLNGNFEQFQKEINNLLKYSIGNNDVHLYFHYVNTENSPSFNKKLINAYIQAAQKMYPDKKFEYHFSYKLESDYIVDSHQCKEMEEVDNYLRENYNGELYVESKNETFLGIGFRKTLSANRKLDSIATKIKNATNNGEPLSNFEKFMMAYEYVTQYVYNEGGDYMHEETSHWIPVIEGDKIVCAGYASLLSALCDRIFLPKEVKVLEQTLDIYDKKNNDNFLASHGNNIIFIKDEKYNIDGLFYVDPCWDSINKNRTDKQQSYCCIPISDMLNNNNYNIDIRTGLANLYLRQNKNYTKFVLDKKSERKENPFFTRIETTEKEKSIEDLVENLFQGLERNNKEQKYFKEEVEEIANYNILSGLSKEDEDMLEKHNEEIVNVTRNKYKDLFEIYKGIQTPGIISQKLVDFFNMTSDLETLQDDFMNEEKVEKAIHNFAKVFSHPVAVSYMEKLKDNGLSLQSLEDFIVKRIKNNSYSKERSELMEKHKEFIKKAKRENAFKVMNSLNKLANSDVVPIDAFINSYKIIAKQNGLTGEEIEKYVENRIIKSIERTQGAFDINECRSCFATTRVEDIIKRVTNKK